ncbi:MAG TPA: FKBP-type peptidyl-prolyl cis-trans isomerase N-terminal domain-containing protein, partial [Candidatus Methylacidiphilales bacterium]
AQMQTQAASDKPAANDQLRNRVSYAMGVNLGEAWKMMRMDVDTGCIARGINNFLQGNEQVMTLDEARAVVTQFGEQLAARQEAERKALGDKNRTEGAAFLERNKTRAGVITTASGLQYKVLAEGTGDFAQPDSWVAVKYQGTLLDGTEIDNSQRYSQPCVFSVRSVLPGWSEALQMMKPGAKWQLVLPPDLAYGSQGGLGVGPDATLIYTFELVSILPGRPEPNAEQITQMNKD